jgi:hypothetical protein
LTDGDIIVKRKDDAEISVGQVVSNYVSKLNIPYLPQEVEPVHKKIPNGGTKIDYCGLLYLFLEVDLCSFRSMDSEAHIILKDDAPNKKALSGIDKGLICLGPAIERAGYEHEFKVEFIS